jgi:hypothetical protein
MAFYHGTAKDFHIRAKSTGTEQAWPAHEQDNKDWIAKEHNTFAARLALA